MSENGIFELAGWEVGILNFRGHIVQCTGKKKNTENCHYWVKL